MLLKHIFSNINISNLLTHVKKYFYYNHFLYIEETIQKFLACSIDKAFIVYQCPLCGSAHKFKISCKSRLCPACGKKYAALWADKTAASLINTKHRAILFTIPKEIKLNLHLLLTIFLNINLIILTLKIKEFIKLVGILKNISLILIFFTMVLLLLFIPLVVTLNGIHISMLLLLLVDLIKIINTLIKNISMLILLLDNGKNLLLILLKVVIIKIKSLKRKLKLLLLLFIKKIQDFSLMLLKMI